MKKITEGVWAAEAPQKFFGLEVGSRMTVLQLPGGLLVHSPVAVDPASVAPLGKLRWILAPNLLHHLHVGPWIDAGGEAWAAPGLQAKRSDLKFAGTIAEGQPFGDEVVVIPTASFPFASEVVVLHRPSRTLILTDLVFNLAPTMPWVTRAAMWCACGYPGVRSTLVERVGMKREIARREMRTILDLDFDRLVMSHGDVVETGGKEALRKAYSWLGI